MANEDKIIIKLKKQIYDEQVNKLWMYFKFLDEQSRDEFMHLMSFVFSISERGDEISKEEMQLEIMRRYFMMQNGKDVQYIIDFARKIQNIESIAAKDKLMEFINGF